MLFHERFTEQMIREVLREYILERNMDETTVFEPKMLRKTRVGTSGYVYKWWFSKTTDETAKKQLCSIEENTGFYPRSTTQKAVLSYYASKFDSVELNATYYKLPTLAASKSWYDQTPPGFRFIAKFSKFATTSKKLANFEEYFDEFCNLLAPLKHKLDGILVQLPPNFTYSTKKSPLDGLSPIDRVKKAGEHVLKYKNITTYIEFRHDSWFEPKAVEFVKKTGLKMVYISNGDVITPPFDIGEQNHVYVRFHGTGTTPYTGNYPDEVLEYISKITSNAKTRWFVFNNTDMANSIIPVNKMYCKVDLERYKHYKLQPSATVDAMKIKFISEIYLA